ncbi:MAG: hypothetical protein KA436_12870, partial [Oligoflexales bacterium]|nr:hypothetical protein [Oligoflexales bacterium]
RTIPSCQAVTWRGLSVGSVESLSRFKPLKREASSQGLGMSCSSKMPELCALELKVLVRTSMTESPLRTALCKLLKSSVNLRKKLMLIEDIAVTQGIFLTLAFITKKQWLLDAKSEDRDQQHQ